MRFLLYLCLGIVASSNANTVVFLQGTCRSGKSSICEEIKRHEGWKAIGSVYSEFSVNVFEELFPEDFSCICAGIDKENIRHAITRDFYVFKDGVNEEQKTDIIEASHKIQKHFQDPEMYMKHREAFSAFSLAMIENLLREGRHNLVADVGWYVSQKSVSQIVPTPKILSLLIYCPLPIVLDRLLYRNKTCLENKSIANYRFFIEPLLSFTSLYDLCHKSKGAIDKLERQTIIKCFETIAEHLPAQEAHGYNSGFMMQECNPEQLTHFKQTILEKFGQEEYMYVVPKKHYDHILRSDEFTPEQCAKQIIMAAHQSS